MRVLITPDCELYPQTTMLFGDAEIVFPAVPRQAEALAGVHVPDEIAARWKAARDDWRQAQAEAEAFLAAAR